MFSLLNFAYTFANKNKYISKCLILISSINIFYLVLWFILIALLNLPDGLEVLLGVLLLLIVLIFYIFAIVINGIKWSYLEINKVSKGFRLATIGFIYLPLLFVIFNIGQDVHWLNNSKVIMVFDTYQDYLSFDDESFGIAISEDKGCKVFDLGVVGGGYALEYYVPKGYQEITLSEVKIPENYRAIFIEHTHTAVVYKGKEYICEVKYNRSFHDIEFERAFYYE